ncbi:MAG TPA: methionyl-tRNA formyltransferase [bacterium]|nr:methionyl-tRNA formyltransferase [bacterium]
MNLVFFGTADFGIPILQALLRSPRHRLVAAVTGPDKPRGRGQERQPTPVGQWLADTGFPRIVKPEDLRDPHLHRQLQAMGADAYVVVAYRILPEAIYTIPRFAFNLHASLLPAYRGAAPIQRAIMAGETETGVTTFLLRKQVDTGDILLQRSLAIDPEENCGELMARMATLGATVVLETLDGLERGDLVPQPQDPSKASPAPKITDEDLILTFAQPSERLINRVRALAPRPGGYTIFRGGAIKVLALRPYPDASLHSRPGAIVAVDKTLGPVVATADRCVTFDLIQPAGKKPMTGADFAHGHHPDVGESFTTPLSDPF